MNIKFIFIAGVEGCGHHGLCPVIDAALRSSIAAGCRDSRVFTRWPLIRDVFDAMWYPVSQSRQQQDIARGRVGELMGELKSLAQKTGCTQYIVEDNSFPSGANRDTGRQWDIVKMTSLLSPYAEVKYLALYRNPVAMTFSHQEFDGGLLNHARVVAEFLEYLNGKLQQLETDIVKVVNYEDLVSSQELLARPLADYLGVELVDIYAGFEHIRKSEKDWRTQMPDRDRELMMGFFDPGRLSLWPVFTDKKYNIINFGGKPD